MTKGWTGRRLRVDLGIQRAWTEEIAAEDLKSYKGGRGLNVAFFSREVPSSISPLSPEYPIAFAVGPLTGTLAPCSGWTSISTSSPLLHPSGYTHVSMPGHWGAQLKFAGFDQCIVQGRSERSVYIWIDGEKVRFEDGRSLWGKDTVETTVSIQEEKEDRMTEVLCIGPAGEKLLPFANLVNRFSWTADHVGLGYVFGAKNLKAIAIHGEKPILLEAPDRFLNLCLALRERIRMDRTVSTLKETGTFFLLGRNGGGLGIKNFSGVSQPDMEENWGDLYGKKYLYGREGCFSCPIHCGRITQVEGNFFGGVHLEGAWSLGPRIGIMDWEGTLRLYRLCQKQGIDHPFSVLPLVFTILLLTKGFLLIRYRNHLKVTSSTTLERMLSGNEKWTFLAFLWSVFILPGLLTLVLLLEGPAEWMAIAMAASSVAGVLLERILFFRVERPVFFLSFIKNPDPNGQGWVRG